MGAQLITKCAVTFVALCAVAAHLIWPALKTDSVTLALLVAAGLPWVLALFKEIELPGGWKFKAQDLQKSERRAGEVGLLDEAALPTTADHEYSFQVVADEDPNLALAGLRIEIERKLNELVQSTGLTVNASDRRMGVGQSLRILASKGVLTAEQRSVLSEMVGLLNSAVHGANVDSQSARRALDIGPRLLATLDKRRQGQ